MNESGGPAEGSTVAVAAAVPGEDEGAVEAEVVGVCAGVGVTGPVDADGAASAEDTGVPVEVPAPEKGERYIFYQSA